MLTVMIYDLTTALRVYLQLSTTSIILSSDIIQNDDIPVPANPGPPGKMAAKRRQREGGELKGNNEWETTTVLCYLFQNNPDEPLSS